MNTQAPSFAQPAEALYIHWPFCAFKCHYCDFISFEKHEHFQDVYHKALCDEITNFAKQMPPASSYKIETIFLGGGTPSLYPLPLLTSLFNVLHNHYNIANTKEITLEANPADITEEKLATWKMLGINRLSVGVQILDDQALYKLNRRQRDADIRRAIRLIPHHFENVSIDLIIGIPDVSEETWLNTLENVVSWPITHISIYFLTIHEKTPLFFKMQQNLVTGWKDEKLLEHYEKSISFLEKNGFKQYEVSNFSKPGYESIHNQKYWDRRPYRGFGIGASSFDRTSRFINENNLGKYLQKSSSPNTNTYSHTETLSGEQALTETLMLGLRQNKGIRLHDVVYSLEEDKKNDFYEKLAALKAQNFIEEDQGVIRLTLKGIVLENEIILKLL